MLRTHALAFLSIASACATLCASVCCAPAATHASTKSAPRATQSTGDDDRNDDDAGATNEHDAGAPVDDAGGASDAGDADGGDDSGFVDAGALGDAGVEGVGDGAPCGTFPAVTDTSANGAFAVTTDVVASPDCTVVRPATLGEGGVQHPVVIWGNGTDAPTSLYKPAFEYWASHGFIVAAANDVDGQGSGAPELACLDWVLAQASTADSAYAGHVCARAAASGHSQGGAGAIMAGRDPRITVTAPLMPYTEQGWGGFDTSSIAQQVASPMLLLSGTLDNNATPSVYQQPVFDDTNVPVFWANRIGADHYTTALGLTNYRATMLAWFRVHLMGDDSFRPLFYGAGCGLCADDHWIVQRNGF